MVKIEESFVKKTRAMMEVPAEERRKARIEKAKSSMPDLVSLYVSAMYLKERELKTSSTGAVFWKEPYVDYNSFLDSLVKMLYDLGDSQTWHPEGKLIFKVDEAINEASIRDEATRAPIVYMKDMPEHLTKIMQRQDPNGSGFFGKMVDAFMRRLLEQSLIEAIRTNLWKDLEDKDLFESVNLGLAKKSRIQAQDKDAVESFSDFVDLDLPSGNLWARKNLNAKTETDVGDYLDFNAVRDLVQDKRFVPEGVPSPPTGEDFNELIDYCTSEYTTYQGKRGYMFTSQTNGEKIFFPFGGTGPGDVDYSGWYWSGKESGNDEGKFLWMNNRQYSVGYTDKAGQHNVRLVLRKYQVDLDMYESASNLGLAKKARVQSSSKDAIENISDYVDLGLPSGTLWCKHNVGADREEESGQEFRYYDAMKTKDNIHNVPSDSEFSELIEYCDKEWIKNESVAGMIFTSKINGKKLFLPAAKTSYRPGEEGWYWSRTRSKHDERDSYLLHISTSEFSGLPLINDVKVGRIYNEFNVRLVIEKANESSLGLAKKTREKSEDKDTIDTLSSLLT